MDSSILNHLAKALTSIETEVLLDDWIRLKSILKDYSPSLNKEISVLISFQATQLATELFLMGNEVSEMDFLKFAERFSSTTGHDRKTAEWCMLMWCNALNKKLNFTYKSLKYPTPAIKFFDPVNIEVAKGEKTYVKWSVENSVKVIFTSHGKDVEVKEFDNREILITKNETVSLKVVGFFNHAISEIREIKVINKVKIREFKSSTEKIVSGNPVKLFWKTDNASEVTISGSKTIYKAIDETIVYPTSTTTYTLTAINKAGSATASRGIRVIQSPQYDYERLIKLPRLIGFTFKQKRELVIPNNHHTPIKLNMPYKKMHYSSFKTSKHNFISGLMSSLKAKARNLFSAS